LAAYAHDLSGLNCTANDVRIIGPGIVINEPCNCTGTFNAQVRFRIVNNTGTDRYCVTVHFCPVRIGSTTFAPGDVVFGDIPANFNGDVVVNIPNYPCGSGLVCFGAGGTGTDGGFAKGEACPSGQCCTVISWNVRANDPCPQPPDRIITSKCRRQQVCIQGRGITTVDCNATLSGAQSDCTVACGATTSVRVCTTSPASFGPFLFQLGTQSYQGTAGETCHTFSVGPVTATTTLTGTVTDASGCARTASVTIRTSAITPVFSVTGNTACNGVQHFTTAVAGFTGCTYAYTIDGVAAANTNTRDAYVAVNSDGSLDVRLLDGDCHTVGVTATCGSCSGSTSRTFSQCVTTTGNCTP
jgi:hypothetical protein